MTFKSFETSYKDRVWHELSRLAVKIVKNYVLLEIIKISLFRPKSKLIFNGVVGTQALQTHTTSSFMYKTKSLQFSS